MANMDGREAFIDIEKRLVIIMPYRVGIQTDIDSEGHVIKTEYHLNPEQQKLHNDIAEYMSLNLWNHVVDCPPFDLEDKITRDAICDCMRSFITTFDAHDKRRIIFKDILEENPDPTLELIYNIRRLGVVDEWNEYFITYEVRDMEHQLRHYLDYD